MKNKQKKIYCKNIKKILIKIKKYKIKKNILKIKK
jgi:hypothetical protein